MIIIIFYQKTWKNLSCTWQAKISLGRAAAVSTSSSHFCHSALVVIDNLKEKQSNSLGNGKVYGASNGKMSSVIFADCFNFWLRSPFNNSWKTKLNSVFPSLSQTAPRVLKKWYIHIFFFIFIRKHLLLASYSFLKIQQRVHQKGKHDFTSFSWKYLNLPNTGEEEHSFKQRI